MRHALYLRLFICLPLLIGSSVLLANPSQMVDQEVLASIDKVPPPPKTINDLVKLLDAAKPDQADIQKSKEILQAAIPANATNSQLYVIYRDRARASEHLGLIKSMLENCQKEQEYVEPGNRDQFFDAQMSCIQAEFFDGNMQGAINRVNKALSSVQARQSNGWQLTFQLLLVNANRQIGDLEAAEAAIRQVDGIMTILKNSNAWSEWGSNWTYQSERARGEYYLAAGKPVAAELSFVRGLNAVEKRVEAFEAGLYKDSTRRVHSRQAVYFNKAIILNRLANSLFAQRKLTEAEYYYRLALKTFLMVGSRNSVAVAGVLNGLSHAVAEQGRIEESLLLSKYALNSSIESGVSESSTNMIYSRRSHAAALVNNEKFAEAAQQFSLIRAAVAKDDFMKDRYKRLNDLDEVVALLFSQQASQAEEVVKDMYERSLKSNGPKHSRTGWIQAFYAMTLEEQGKSKEAKEHFAKAMPVLIDQTRNDAENQTISLKFQKRFSILVESYIGVLFTEAKQNPQQEKQLIAQAFQLADMARGSSVQRALTQSTARSTIKDPVLERLARKEQDLQRRANS
ncbi:MAG: hypothetical protein RJB21_276, partial [Pseudomonadota bacterium]